MPLSQRFGSVETHSKWIQIRFDAGDAVRHPSKVSSRPGSRFDPGKVSVSDGVSHGTCVWCVGTAGDISRPDQENVNK